MAGVYAQGPTSGMTIDHRLSGLAGRSDLAQAGPSMGSRMTDFVEKNKRALLLGLGASVLVAGSAAGYLYYTRPGVKGGKGKGEQGGTSYDDQGGIEEGLEGGASRKKSKKKRSKKSNGGAAVGGQPGAAATGNGNEQIQSDSEGSSDGRSILVRAWMMG